VGHYEFTIEIPEQLRDAVVSGLYDHGATGFVERKKTLLAYFPDHLTVDHIEQVLNTLREMLKNSGFEGSFSWKSAHIPDMDWNEEWKKSFIPFEAGKRFIILPPWESTESNRIPIIIDPGMAFGTGHHETTRSCLALLERVSFADGGFLDIGTGTGILAIGAAKLGFDPVMAVDTDPRAIESAAKNIALNRVSRINIREGSIQSVDGSFNVITANLVSFTLIQIAPDIASRLSVGGQAILSGILHEQEDEVIQAMVKEGLSLTGIIKGEKWVTLTVKKEPIE